MRHTPNVLRHLKPIDDQKPEFKSLKFKKGAIVLPNDTHVSTLYEVKRGCVMALEIDAVRGQHRPIFHFEKQEGRMSIFAADAYRNSRTTSFAYIANEDDTRIVLYNTACITKLSDDGDLGLLYLVQAILHGSELAEELRPKLMDEYVRTGLQAFNPANRDGLLEEWRDEEEIEARIAFCESIMTEIAITRRVRASKPTTRLKRLTKPTESSSDGIVVATTERDDMRTLTMSALPRDPEKSPAQPVTLTIPKGYVLLRPDPDRLVETLFRLTSGVIEVISDLGTSKERSHGRYSRVGGQTESDLEWTPILGARSFFSGRPNSRHYIALTNCTVETITQQKIGTLYAERDCTWLVRELIRNSDFPDESRSEWITEMEKRFEMTMLPGFRREEMQDLLLVRHPGEDQESIARTAYARSSYADYACDMLFLRNEMQTDERGTDMKFMPLERPI